MKEVYYCPILEMKNDADEVDDSSGRLDSTTLIQAVPTGLLHRVYMEEEGRTLRHSEGWAIPRGNSTVSQERDLGHPLPVQIVRRLLGPASCLCLGTGQQGRGQSSGSETYECERHKDDAVIEGG